MYDAIYDNMVDAGVAVKVDNAIMYDKEGAITSDVSKMFGRPTKYILT